MHDTHEEGPDIEPGDKAIVRSVRFKPEQWESITAYTAKHGIKHGSFIRNAALSAAGLLTDAHEMRRQASVLEGLGTVVRPVPVKTQAAKPAPKKAAAKAAGRRR